MTEPTEDERKRGERWAQGRFFADLGPYPPWLAYAHGLAANRVDLAHVRKFLQSIANDVEWVEGESMQTGPDYHPGTEPAWTCQRCGAESDSDDDSTRPDIDHYANCEADTAARLLAEPFRGYNDPGHDTDWPCPHHRAPEFGCEPCANELQRWQGRAT